MTWQELPVWAKIRMLINQKIQCNIINPSVFIKDIEARKRDNGFTWSESCENFTFWYDIFKEESSPKTEDPLNSKLYIYESTPGKYSVKMSHSETRLYFTKQELSDLGLTNPIIENLGSCKYHTFEEHLNNPLKETNPECLAFKEWAVNNGYWVQFKYDYNDLWIIDEFTLDNWIQNCNEYRYTGFDIIKKNILFEKEEYWIQIWDKYIQSQKKSPAEIFIDWALTHKRICTAPSFMGNIILKDFKCSKNEFITKIPSNITLEGMVNYIISKVNKDFSWYNSVNEVWLEYLKTINYANQLQREENPVTGSTGESRFGIHLGGDIIKPSRGYRSNQKGCEIFGETISLTKAGLSFGHNCSL